MSNMFLYALGLKGERHATVVSRLERRGYLMSNRRSRSTFLDFMLNSELYNSEQKHNSE